MRSGFVLGIDFGTSNTVAVLRWPDGRVKPLLFDGSPLLRSAVYLEPSGRLVVGRDAVHSARLDPARFEPNPKRSIDYDTVLLGGAEVPVVQLVAAVLRRVDEEARRIAGGSPITEVALTHPASWGGRRRDVLLAAAQAAGLPPVRMVAEPIAAAYAFLTARRVPVPVGGSVVVYDLGAGTFDVSVVRLTANGFEIVAADGLADVGGLDVDAALVGYFGAVHGAGRGAEWQRLEYPVSAADRRARRQLWDDVQVAKELLSRSGATVVYLAGLDVEVPLGRDQLDHLATGLLRRTADLTKLTMHRAGVDAGTVAGVFLVGGASRMPLVATLVHRIVGVPPLVVEQPELVVAEGSVIPGAAPETTTTVVLTPPPAPAWPLTPPPTQPVPTQPAPAQPSPAQPVPTHPARAQPFPAQPVPIQPARAQPAPAQPFPAQPFPAEPAPAQPSLDEDDEETVPLDGDEEDDEEDGDEGLPYASSWAWLPQPRLGFAMPGRPWRDAPFHPLRIALPSGTGYTIRARFSDPEETDFLGRDGRPLLFGSAESLAAHLAADDSHILAEVDGWPAIKDWFANLVQTPDEDHEVDLDLVPYNLGFESQQWIPGLLIAARDLAAELAAAFDLDEVADLLATGSLLDRLDDVMRRSSPSSAGWSTRRRLRAFEPAEVADGWRRVVDHIDAAVVWAPR